MQSTDIRRTFPLSISAGYVVRFCTPGHPDPDCTWTKSAKSDHDIGFCACDTDLCNSASLLEYSMTVIVYLCFSIVLLNFYKL